jgi:hypothetical protein
VCLTDKEPAGNPLAHLTAALLLTAAAASVTVNIANGRLLNNGFGKTADFGIDGIDFAVERTDRCFDRTRKTIDFAVNFADFSFDKFFTQVKNLSLADLIGCQFLFETAHIGGGSCLFLFKVADDIKEFGIIGVGVFLCTECSDL